MGHAPLQRLVSNSVLKKYLNPLQAISSISSPKHEPTSFDGIGLIFGFANKWGTYRPESELPNQNAHLWCGEWEIHVDNAESPPVAKLIADLPLPPLDSPATGRKAFS